MSRAIMPSGRVSVADQWRSLRERLAPAARLGALGALGALAAPLYRAILPAATPETLASDPARFGWPLAALTALYVAAAALVWLTRPVGAWRWAELAVIVVIGLALRALVFGVLPGLSHDSYRYAWDPQLIAHGLSPYTHTPNDPELAFLRDTSISPNVRFRDAPTIYPPAAQGLFLLVYLLDPRDIYGVKLAMVVCDALAFALTLALLRGRRLDLRRAMLYWWAPIPILEFAVNGHVDAEAILLTLAALLASAGTWRGARVATGALIGLAAMTKIYPILFVIPLIRRRDYGLLAGLAATIAIGYAPFAILGLGGGGFLGAYLSQRFVDQGPLLTAISALATPLTHDPVIQVSLDLLALAALAALTALYRWRVGLSPEAGMLALSAIWMALSPHLFPWYIATLAPLLALFPVAGRGRWPSAPILALWTFLLFMPFTYVIFAPGGNPGLFIWFSLIPAAIAITPLASARGRTRVLAALRRLAAPPTQAELRAAWEAWAPSGATAQ